MTTPQEDVTTTSHQNVSTKSQTSLKWITQRRLSGTSPRRLSGTYPRRPISTSVRRILQVPNATPNNVAFERLYHLLELRCWHALSVGLYYVFKLLCHNLCLVGFHVSFKYQIKHQISLISNRREISVDYKSNLDYKLAELLLHVKVTSATKLFGVIK